MKIKVFLFLLFLSNFLYAENICLKFEDSVKEQKIDEVLYIGYGSKVSEVKIIDKDSKIKKIVLEGTSFLKDYSFVTDCKELDILVINDVFLENINFIENCNKLKILSLYSVKIKELPNIEQLDSLEFLSLTNCDLIDFKKITKHGKKLKYINLCNNNISKIEKLPKNDTTIYFMGGNKVFQINNKNYSFENIYKQLPEEYIQFIR